ncbi:MAG TPA: hypothetical protein VIX17_23575 [Pyrinomonadaceae bacterium]|jgi:hypothetical protein
MPELTADARKTLRQSFEEIADRASRLGEWISYQEKLRPLQSNFVTVLREVETGVTQQGFIDGAFTRIKAAWVTCRQFGLLDLQLFNEGIQYIDKALENGAKVRYDATKFFTLAEQIDADLRKASAQDLNDHCSEFDRAMTMQLAVLLTTLKSEMRDLCTLTQQLHQDFSKD